MARTEVPMATQSRRGTVLRAFRFASSAWSRRLVAPVLVPMLVLVGSSPAAWAEAGSGNFSGQAAVSQGVAGPGTAITVEYSAKPPVLTRERLRRAEEAMARHNRPGPAVVPVPVPENLPRGPETRPPSGTNRLQATEEPSAMPQDFTIFRDKVIPASGISGGYGSSSYTMEPSSGNNGKYVFMTGNWYASRSTDNGATWGFVDPYTIFGSWGFCCDQVTLYDASRNRQFWLLQGDGLTLAVSNGNDLANWCYYRIDSSWFGQPASVDIDYNDMAIGEKYLYITSNLFPAVGSGAGLLRLPIDALASCSGFGYGYTTWMPPNWSFTWKPVQGATNVMYWASNWNYDLAAGSTIRVFRWAEDSGSYNWSDKTINAFPWMDRSGGQNCTSGGVVNNWCQWNDSRVKGGALARGVLYFAIDASQGGGFVYPYSRIVKVGEADMSYLGDIDVNASWGPIQYVTLSPNAHGDLGLAWAWSGTAGASSYYPSTSVGLLDDYSPGYPENAYFLYGAGNTCQYSGIWRWGDYLTVRPFLPAGDVFVGAAYAIKGNNCGGAGWYAEPHHVVFGRARDTGSYRRWKTK